MDVLYIDKSWKPHKSEVGVGCLPTTDPFSPLCPTPDSVFEFNNYLCVTCTHTHTQKHEYLVCVYYHTHIQFIISFPEYIPKAQAQERHKFTKKPGSVALINIPQI